MRIIGEGGGTRQSSEMIKMIQDSIQKRVLMTRVSVALNSNLFN
jgi:hypothetical protein